MIEALFEKNGFNTVTAINGQIAYEEVQQKYRNERKTFDLIVLDFNMPVTDGFEACEKIL